LEIFAGLSIVSLSGFFGGFYAEEIWLIFKSPITTVSRICHLGSFIMSGKQRVHGSRYRATYAVPFFIRVNPHSRNTSKHHS